MLMTVKGKSMEMKKLLAAVACIGALACAGTAYSAEKYEEKSELKIISYNAYWGMKSDDSDGKQKFAEWAKKQDADIIAWQEMNHFTQESLEKFAESYGHKFAVLLKEPKVAGQEEFFPTALTSKYPIVNTTKHLDNLWHGALFADIGKHHFVVTHLNPFWTSKRIDEMALILDAIKYGNDPQGKWIIAGDLNSLSPLDKDGYDEAKLTAGLSEKEKQRPILKNLVDGKLDYTVQKDILARGYIDVLRDKNPKTFIATAPTKIYYDQSSVPLRYDYIYVSPAMKNDIIDVKVLKDDFTDQYSDHYPVQMIIKN
jgi:exodeoxyribonuclease-3